MTGLNELLALMRTKGFRALVVMDAGGGLGPYTAAVMDGLGKQHHRSIITHTTPAGALVELASSLGGGEACPALKEPT